MAALAPVRIAREGDKKCVDTRSSKTQGNLVAPAVRNEKKLRCCRSSRTCSPHDKLTNAKRVKVLSARALSKLSVTMALVAMLIFAMGTSASREVLGGKDLAVSAGVSDRLGPKSGKLKWWCVAAAVSGLVILLGLLFGVNAFEIDKMDFKGASGFMSVGLMLVGLVCCCAAGWQIVLGCKINKNLENEYSTRDLEDDNSSALMQLGKQRRDVFFWMGLILAFLCIVGFIVGLSVDHEIVKFDADGVVQDIAILGTTMVTCTLIGTTVLAGAAMFFSQSKDYDITKGENATLSAQAGQKFKEFVGLVGKYNHRFGKKFPDGTRFSQQDKMTWWKFFLMSKTFWVCVAAVIAIVGALSGVMGGEDGKGISQMVKTSIYAIGGTILGCSIVCGALRYGAYKRMQKEGDLTYDTWTNQKEKKSEWDSRMKSAAKVVLGLLFLALAIYMTVYGFDASDAAVGEGSPLLKASGHSGAAWATLFVLWSGTFLGGAAAGLNIYNKFKKTDDVPMIRRTQTVMPIAGGFTGKDESDSTGTGTPTPSPSIESSGDERKQDQDKKQQPEARGTPPQERFPQSQQRDTEEVRRRLAHLL